MRLYNLWSNLAKPKLKPNAVSRKLVILSDITVDNLKPFTELFSACYGITLDIQITAYDSVEQLVFDQKSSLVIDSSNTVLLMLSEHWLQRYLGKSVLVDDHAVANAKKTYYSIIQAIMKREPAHLLVANHSHLAFPFISNTVITDKGKGWNAVLTELNGWLYGLQNTNLSILDFSESVFGATGRSALGRVSYLRAKMLLEPKGTIAVAREIASALANICGKTHRALITDWDNTIWGGVIGETGLEHVVTGPETPDGLGYYFLQQYLKSLKSQGVLLAAASKNDPSVVDWLQKDNDRLALKAEDFDSCIVNWEPKSQSVSKISEELGFGPEFMVFLDDNLFELTEVFLAHPYIDIIQASPDPEKTLHVINGARFFNYVSLSSSDLNRSKTVNALKKQREYKSTFNNLEEFLSNIKIQLRVSQLDDSNVSRVAQMFQKTNQFNLTTRRHTESQLKEMQSKGTQVFVVSYSDTFGPQGIISVVVILPRKDEVFIESWLMSCRVLNRTVEYALFKLLARKFQGKKIMGEFIRTEKNDLVKHLYKNLGFEIIKKDENTGAEIWEIGPDILLDELPVDYAEIEEK